MWRLATLLLALALAACGPRPEPANPAFWEVEGPAGRKAWLFGTIHSLARPALWRSAVIDGALDQADLVVVEVADLDDDEAMSQAFASLSQSPGQPPLAARVDPGLRGKLAKLMREGGMKEDQFAATETWAAALTLARAGSGELNSAYGIDRAVIDDARDRELKVIELEGAGSQLALFDTLPEQEQRDLLESVIADSTSLDTESGSLAEAWRTGDMQLIERETYRGMLADPELRAVLFTLRNANWAERIIGLMAEGARPFVAVGAAHMAGPEGLPALLEAKGYTVRRIQ
ncbi:MAG: TraB/GumN family protein [Novosphingobium sp.]|nr:TraB/GumN family protein [Novosphingobium sp.]MCP5401357.1 TraB/GumN family protein [Novosphingobium sp.]